MFVNSVIVITIANYELLRAELDNLMYTAKGMS